MRAAFSTLPLQFGAYKVNVFHVGDKGKAKPATYLTKTKEAVNSDHGISDVNAFLNLQEGNQYQLVDSHSFVGHYLLLNPTEAALYDNAQKIEDPNVYWNIQQKLFNLLKTRITGEVDLKVKPLAKPEQGDNDLEKALVNMLDNEEKNRKTGSPLPAYMFVEPESLAFKE